MEFIPKYYTHALSNGLELVAIPLNRGSKVISTNLYVKAGSRNEVLGKTGIAHMLEHMSFKSTTHLKEGEFDQIVKSVGGVDNAATSFDYTHFFIRSANMHLPTALRLLREILGDLALKDEEFQRERKVVYEERLWRVDNNPFGYAYFRLFNNAYIYHPYHWTPIGFKEDILNWTIEDIREFYHTYYVPNNSFLLVAGDIEPDFFFKEAEKWFGDCHPRPHLPHLHQKEPPLDGDKIVKIERESKSKLFIIAFPVPPFNHPDILLLDVTSDLLTGGKSGRLIQEFFYKRKMVSNISSYVTDLKDGGLFIINGVCNRDQDPLKVAEEVKKFVQNYTPTSKEMEKIRLNNQYDFLHAFETSSGTASIFGSYLAKGDLKPMLTYYDRVEKLQPSDIGKVKDYFAKSINILLYPTTSHRGGK
jgi:predicted Zn-dependent peptidase